MSKCTAAQAVESMLWWDGYYEKGQVIAMVTSLLRLPSPPKPDDTADALAIALCHGQNAGSALGRFLRK